MQNMKKHCINYGITWWAILPCRHEYAQSGEVGFQGTNPETDFRGMGYLGLFVLTSFSENNFSHTGDRARAILNRSRGPADNPLKFYPFACAGIQITNFALELLRTRKLDRWFYELDTSADSVSLDRNVLEIFVRLYAEMFEVLDVYWAQNPINVMDLGEYSTISRQNRPLDCAAADCVQSDIIPILLKIIIGWPCLIVVQMLLFIRLLSSYY